MKTTTFFTTHPVFTYDEFAAFAATHGSGRLKRCISGIMQCRCMIADNIACH
ncbi:MAG: hypothetical protein ABFD83_00620 [Armatimonadota bacterium]